VRNTFEANYQSTIGVDLTEKSLKLSQDTKFKFIIWDIAGQKKSIAPYRKKFYQGANFALIVIDRTRPNDIESIKNLYDDIKDHTTSNINFVLVGNKSDLVDEIKTSEEDIKKIADHYEFHSYILTSAKTGENVNDVFLYIAYTFLESV
jgi:Ras-related protein Rab-1A